MSSELITTIDTGQKGDTYEQQDMMLYAIYSSSCFMCSLHHIFYGFESYQGSCL